MSFTFRERLKIALREKLAEKLGLTEEDKKFILDNLFKICPTSDEVAKAYRDSIGSNASIDEIVDKMSDSDFEDFVETVLEIAFKKLGYKKGKKKSAEPEEEKDSDSDSDSDSQEQEQEEEIACSEESK